MRRQLTVELSYLESVATVSALPQESIVNYSAEVYYGQLQCAKSIAFSLGVYITNFRG